MGDYVFRLPDVGEGVAEAEIVTWFVEVGDRVKADDQLAEVVTDKVSIVLPSPVTGVVVSRLGDPGDLVAVGSDLVILRTENGESGTGEADTAPDETEADLIAEDSRPEEPAPDDPSDLATVGEFVTNTRPMSTPPVRRRAKEAGLDLSTVTGTGPEGRITHADLDRILGDVEEPPSIQVTEIPVVGVRRAIADHMSLAKSKIPHITYVEEVDVTPLQALRKTLNRKGDGTQLTLLPFLMLAIARAVSDHPYVNGRFDDDRGVVEQHADVHIGVATQTGSGLVVPVVRNVEAMDLWACADEIKRLSDAARAGRATTDELKGSTITVSSLGALGGIVSTPVINHPEVAIVGVNKIQIRPHWDGSQFVPREMMNLSSAFDHRVIDGWDAATFIQRVKELLEQPALIFI